MCPPSRSGQVRSDSFAIFGTIPATRYGGPSLRQLDKATSTARQQSARPNIKSQPRAREQAHTLRPSSRPAQLIPRGLDPTLDWTWTPTPCFRSLGWADANCEGPRRGDFGPRRSVSRYHDSRAREHAVVRLLGRPRQRSPAAALHGSNRAQASAGSWTRGPRRGFRRDHLVSLMCRCRHVPPDTLPGGGSRMVLGRARTLAQEAPAQHQQAPHGSNGNHTDRRPVLPSAITRSPGFATCEANERRSISSCRACDPTAPKSERAVQHETHQESGVVHQIPQAQRAQNLNAWKVAATKH